MGYGPFSTPPIEGGGGGGGVSGLSTADGGTAIADNAIIRGDGTDGIQGSTALIQDTGHFVLPDYSGSQIGINAQHGRLNIKNTANSELANVFAEAFSANNVVLMGATYGIALGSGATIRFSSTTSGEGLADIGLARNAAGVLRVTDGSAGIGDVLHSVLVEANTAGSGAPNVITAAESNTLYTNEGATAANHHTLPTAAAGLVYEFIVQDADGMRIVANTDDTIRVIDKVTAAAGYIESATIGSVVRLMAINATEYVATSIHGVWTDGTWTYDDTGNTTP